MTGFELAGVTRLAEGGAVVRVAMLGLGGWGVRFNVVVCMGTGAGTAGRGCGGGGTMPWVGGADG